MTAESEKLLGDKVADLMEKTGVARLTQKAAQAIGKDDCGCKKRQQKLNDLHQAAKNAIS